MSGISRSAWPAMLVVLICLTGGLFAAAQPRPAVEPVQPRRRNAERLPRQQRERGPRMPRFAERRMRERMMERIREGDAIGEQGERWLDRYLMTRLLRAPSMNAVDSAHYSVAEIHLNAREHAKCLDRLEKVLAAAGDREDETVWVTHLNIANVCRRHTGDVQRAIREYKLVKGVWAGFARRELLGTLEEMGELDQAVGLLLKQHDAASEKGEKLALLQQVAELYERNEEAEKAIATYDRITREFTHGDIEQMKKAAAQYALDNAEKAAQLREAGRFEEAEELIRETHRRLDTLRSQRRQDEVRAMEEVLPQAMEGLERTERARVRRERRGEVEPEPRAPERPMPE